MALLKRPDLLHVISEAHMQLSCRKSFSLFLKHPVSFVLVTPGKEGEADLNGYVVWAIRKTPLCSLAYLMHDFFFWSCVIKVDSKKKKNPSKSDLWTVLCHAAYSSLRLWGRFKKVKQSLSLGLRDCVGLCRLIPIFKLELPCRMVLLFPSQCSNYWRSGIYFLQGESSPAVALRRGGDELEHK